MVVHGSGRLLYVYNAYNASRIAVPLHKLYCTGCVGSQILVPHSKEGQTGTIREIGLAYPRLNNPPTCMWILELFGVKVFDKPC